MMLDRSNGNALVWVESQYGELQYANSTLWTAAFVTSETQLVRRRVAKLHDVYERGAGRAVANRGVVLSLIDRNKALITRLSDGMGWIVTAEPNTRFTTPLWVDDADVLIETADDTPDASGHRYDFTPDGILRVARATLGQPTVPSGL